MTSTCGAPATISCEIEPPLHEGDPNGDGIVDPLEVGYILSRFGDCPE